eukprot:Hpha_TRINITY_DN29948_c0_g1::TRINITY_DN29948_c0_g1_i1::g.131809::m.131809/K02058/ABC.SS.S; simple sugar transport system substrate-binding protein
MSAAVLLLAYAVAGGRLEPGPDGFRTLKVGMVLLGSPADLTWNYRHNLGRIGLVQNILNRYHDIRVNSSYVVTGNDAETNVTLARSYLDFFGREGYHLVFSTSYGLQTATLESARLFPNTNWVHITGTAEGSPNFATAAARIYQARWLTGMVGASQTKTGKIGYVAAFITNSEVLRGVNAFLLGARKVDKSVRVYINYLDSWYDPRRTVLGSEWLRRLGCDVITGHINGRELYQGFLNHGLKGIGYYADFQEHFDDKIVVSSHFDWVAMYTRYALKTIKGEPVTREFDGMEGGTPVTSSMTQHVPLEVRTLVQQWRERLISGADTHPVHGGSSLIFCGPLVDEYGETILRNSTDCADLNTHPWPAHQKYGGLLGTNWLLDGVEDLGLVGVPELLCPAGHAYTWLPEGKEVLDKTRHPKANNGNGKVKIRFDYTCSVCPAGTYAPPWNMDSMTELEERRCLPCPLQTHSRVEGAERCELCHHGTKKQGEGNTECLEKKATWGDRHWWVVVVISAGFLLAAAPPVAWLVRTQRWKIRVLRDNNSVAETCAESIAAMQLEEVSYIRSIENPSRIVSAFIVIIDHLTEFRRFLPPSVLATLPDSRTPEEVDPNTENIPGPYREYPGSTGVSPDRPSPPFPFPSSPMDIQPVQPLAAPFHAAGSLALRKAPATARVTLVCSHRAGFLGMLRGKQATTVAKWLFESVQRWGTTVTRSKGVVDLMVGDQRQATFNAVLPCPSHAIAGLRVLHASSQDNGNAGENLPFSSAAVTGPALCGDFGSSSMLRFMVLGGAASALLPLARLAALWRLEILLDAQCQSDAVFSYDLKMLGAVLYAKRSDTPVPVYLLTGQRQTSTVDPHEGWMYLSETRGKWEEHNRAMEGRLRASLHPLIDVEHEVGHDELQRGSCLWRLGSVRVDPIPLPDDVRSGSPLGEVNS